MPLTVTTHSARHRTDGNSITIGLVNNMPDEALRATERQFKSLLQTASDGIPLQLSLYSLPGVPRNEASRQHMSGVYSDIEDLWTSSLDGLIVTGREPLASTFEEEPYWQSFTRLVDWAQESTRSTIWSCLAAHAAVFYMDGIERIKRINKLFGVFECTHACPHTITAGLSMAFQLPHSRWNGLRQEELAACGYSILTRTRDMEIDTFIKQQNSLFVFFQGHPEYETETLLREYRRDIGRYFKGQIPSFPLMPQNYFNPPTEDTLMILQQRNPLDKTAALLTSLSAALENSQIDISWRAGAASIYGNWIASICARKEEAVRLKAVDDKAPARRSVTACY